MSPTWGPQGTLGLLKITISPFIILIKDIKSYFDLEDPTESFTLIQLLLLT